MPSQTPISRLKSILKGNTDVARRAVSITELAPRLPNSAIDLLDAALTDADPLLQVAIMDAYFEMTGDAFHEPDLERILVQATQMGDNGEQLYMVARVALGRITGLSMDRLDEWGDGQLEITALAQTRRRARRRGPPVIVDEITIIIHGTWAANGTWWQPGGDFFEYTKTELRRDNLYGKADLFKWSGKNRDKKRRQAATSLKKWMQGHPAREVNIFAHSHGANVAMLMTHDGIPIHRLVMLSPPVRSDYYAKWSNIGQAFNIQASSDPVVAIARGGQWFNNNHVSEKKLRASGHSASHDPSVWRKEPLAKFIGIPW